MSDNRTHFDKLHALSSSVIGFEFEFYTNMLKGRAAESLSKLINKKVVVSERYHSNIVVDASTCKLEPDYSGGSKMMEFITGPLPYNEAITIVIKVLNWIDENGWTTDRCAFQFSVSFDKLRKDVKDKIENLDKLKFILGFDESFIYSKFGDRSKMFKVPEDKYYGVNFTKIPKGYLEFRYLGNRDYQKKTKDIREIIDYAILYLYDLLSHRISGYSKEDLSKLQSMMNQYTKVVRSFGNPDFFFRNYPDFHIFVDLKGLDENIKTYWSIIRDKIFDIIVEGNVTSGYFNYDTTTGRCQLKDARSREALELKDIDLILCDIKNGVIKNCNIYSSKIKKSSIEECYIVNDTTVTSSKIKDCVVDFGNELEDCFIDCQGKSINCKIKDGVLRAGEIGENADVSKETLKVKGWEDFRKERFVTDKRLKDLNARYNNQRFGNMNF